MKQRRKSMLLFCMVVSSLTLLFAGVCGQMQVAHAATSLFYGFEDGTDGFTAPSWLSANAGQPTQSAAQASEGSHSLALPVNFTNGSFDQAGADEVIDNYNPVDLTIYSSVSFDVYTPVPNVSADLVFNDPWNPPATMRSLQVGWNTVTFDISPTSQDFPNAGAYFNTAKEFILHVVGKGVTYNGPIYFDNVRFIPTTHPVIRVVAPQMDETLSVPQGQTSSIQAAVTSAPGRQITAVTFKTPQQSGTMTLDPTNNVYTAAWDLWKEGDGLKTLSITATDNSERLHH